MIQLNDEFLVSLGLGALPTEDKRKMLQHIFETLELRVGMRLAQRMNDQQLDEFEKFVDADQAYAKSYLDQKFPGWEQDQTYLAQRQKATAQGKPAEVAIPEFAALKWLGVNFPDHKSAVEQELEKLKTEIKAQAPVIIEATLADSTPAGT